MPSTPEIRILLVEDSPAYARLVELLLEDALPTLAAVRHAGTLAGALRVLAHATVDCVLLDLSLPDAQGTEGLDRLAAAHPGLPIVVLSGREAPGLPEELAARGALAFVHKGEEAAGLAVALAGVLD